MKTTHPLHRGARRSRWLAGAADFEARLLDGDMFAARALVRQACGPNTLELPFAGLELRVQADGTGGERLTFEGYASVTNQGYLMADWLGDYTEVVRGGAFERTLAAEPDVIFCLNHEWGSAPMARTKAGTLTLEEDSTGLLTVAKLDASRADVHIVRSAMDAGELDAMSFAFWVTSQQWSPDYMQRDILEVDLDGGDTSVVTWPASPLTEGTTSLRAVAGQALARSRVPRLLLERAREEKRAGAKLSTATINTLQSVLDLIAECDVAVDSAQEILASLMGVDNPDDAGETDNTSSDEGQANAGPAPEVIRERLRLAELARK